MKFKVGDRVKTLGGWIGIVTKIWEDKYYIVKKDGGSVSVLLDENQLTKPRSKSLQTKY